MALTSANTGSTPSFLVHTRSARQIGIRSGSPIRNLTKRVWLNYSAFDHPSVFFAMDRYGGFLPSTFQEEFHGHESSRTVISVADTGAIGV